MQDASRFHCSLELQGDQPVITVTEDETPQEPPRADATAAEQDYIVDKIISHRYDENGEVLYQVRWYGYSSADDTEEPTRHLRHSHVARYWKSRKVAPPPSIEEAREG